MAAEVARQTPGGSWRGRASSIAWQQLCLCGTSQRLQTVQTTLGRRGRGCRAGRGCERERRPAISQGPPGAAVGAPPSPPPSQPIPPLPAAVCCPAEKHQRCHALQRTAGAPACWSVSSALPSPASGPASQMIACAVQARGPSKHARGLLCSDQILRLTAAPPCPRPSEQNRRMSWELARRFGPLLKPYGAWRAVPQGALRCAGIAPGSAGMEPGGERSGRQPRGSAAGHRVAPPSGGSAP